MTEHEQTDSQTPDQRSAEEIAVQLLNWRKELRGRQERMMAHLLMGDLFFVKLEYALNNSVNLEWHCLQPTLIQAYKIGVTRITGFVDPENFQGEERLVELTGDGAFVDRLVREGHIYMYHVTFWERSKIAAELGALNALGRIVGMLCRAISTLVERQSFDNSSFLARRCLELTWGREYSKNNEQQPYNWWLRQIIDYVSGLTDNYARQLSHEIEGT